MNGKKVLVTTEYRGVFFGTLVEQNDRVVVLEDARNVVYWSSGLRGFLGLAERGPDSECRIGPAVSRIELYGVTSISYCSDVAVQAMEKAPWKS